MSLTDAKIRAAKPKAKPYKMADDQGLYLLINPQSPRYPKGSRLWRWRYSWGGRERLLALGAYPDRSLAKARDERDKHRQALQAGRDPGAERQVAKALARVGTARSFEAVARDWHARRMIIWTPAHAKEVITSLEAFIFPEFGSVDIGAITTPMALAALRHVEDRGTINTAHRLRTTLEHVFAYAIASGISENNPGLLVKGALTPNRHTKLPAVIDLSALIAMLRAAEAQFCQPVTKAALRFIALTAARPGMIRGMLWDEIEGADGNRPTWHLPADRMKTDREYFCPLSGPALDLLRALKPLTGHGRFVFPNHRHSNKPMSANAIGYLLIARAIMGHIAPMGSALASPRS